MADYDALQSEIFAQELMKDADRDVRDHDPQVRRAVIRTSDRILFKRCRRRWGWQSHLRHNLGPKTGVGPLWFGSGFHFALEDFHGYNRFGDPAEAFKAYVKATHKHNPNRLPDDWIELTHLGKQMFDYYKYWLKGRDPLQTYWHEGKPQVEVNFKFPIPIDAKKYGYDEVIYSGQLDRVAIDDNGHLWIVEYKTAKVIQTLHYQTDPQISTYMWAAENIYDKPLAGVIYMQFKKDVPHKGNVLKNGTISVAQNQATTHRMYRQGLLERYGSMELVPSNNIDYLNRLAHREGEEHDDFIRRDRVYRNAMTAESEGAKILMECEDMLNPNLPLYPNPTRDCAFMCSFLSACVSMDDGSDWENELELNFEERDLDYDSWRKCLVWPEDRKLLEAPFDFNEVK